MGTMKLLVEPGDDPLPYFAEYPYFIWGDVDYDSEGDCERPTDRRWPWLWLMHRDTEEIIEIGRPEDDPESRYEVTGQDQVSVVSAAYLTALRTSGRIIEPGGRRAQELAEVAGRVPDLSQRLRAADHVAELFSDPALGPYDSYGWWPYWKWTERLESLWSPASGMDDAIPGDDSR